MSVNREGTKRKSTDGDDDTSRPSPPFQVPTNLAARCKRVYGWNDDFTNRAILGYRQFMDLKVSENDWKGIELAPPPRIEDVWQQHILDTEQYEDACRRVGAPHRIHYNPDHHLKDDFDTLRVDTETLASQYARDDEEVWSFDAKETASSSGQNKRRRTNDTEPPSRREALTIFVRWNQNEDRTRPNDLYFKIRPDTRMHRVFDRFELHWATGDNDDTESSFTFFFGSRMVKPSDTALSLGLEPDDMLYATRCSCVEHEEVEIEIEDAEEIDL